MSSSDISVTSKATTGTSYFSSSDDLSVCASAPAGCALLTKMMKGLPSAFSSRTTRSSASTYAVRGRSTIDPSVVTTTPSVECS